MKNLNECTLWSVFDPSIDSVILTEDLIAEMARVDPSLSGINVVIFVSSKQYVDGKHWARIKVSNIPGTFSKTDNFVVTISSRPEVVAGNPKYKQSELEDIFDWVKLNRSTLLKYWNKKYDDDADFYAELQKI